MSGNVVYVPQPQAPYNASKAAVRHLAASFAVEWAAAGIRVNCISPGYMVTEL
jgi:D-arabinitol 2-dehydrogenase